MKKLMFVIAFTTAVACSSTKSVETPKSKGLYQVLTQQSYGGASIRFFEVLTLPNEIAMLKGDPNLQGMISDDDLNKSNFVILNMGEKPTGGYSISVQAVRETADAIIVTVKENMPEAGAMTTMAVTNPYSVVKINSKKKIEIE